MPDDDPFGGEDSEDERLVDAALQGPEDADELPEVGEELVDIEEEDDQKKVLKNPGDVILQEYEAHRTDPMPYRSWWSHCIKGVLQDFGTGASGKRNELHSVDPTTCTVRELFALASGDVAVVKILIVKCNKSTCVFADVVPQKQLDPALYAMERLKRDVMWLGHTKFCSDIRQQACHNPHQ